MNPVSLFGLALLNVISFEFLYGLFCRILPDDKGEWCSFYWLGTLILCWSTHIFVSSPQQLAAWAPALFVALIHCVTSFSTGPIESSAQDQPDDKHHNNPSSFSNRVNTTKTDKKEGE